MPDSDPEAPRYRVVFEPLGRRGLAGSSDTVLDSARAAGVELVAVCGGEGICGTCRVRLLEGKLSPPGMVEEAELERDDLAAGWRLACKTTMRSDVRFEIPPASLATSQRLQLEGQDVDQDLDPIVAAHMVHMQPPGAGDQQDDWSRLKAALRRPGKGVVPGSSSVMRHCSEELRKLDWTARVAVRSGTGEYEVVVVLGVNERLLGVAFDIGTTKIAAYLVDLEDGRTLARAGAANPQIAFGEDVVSRIAFANLAAQNESLLQSRLVAAVNDLILELCTRSGVLQRQIVDVAITGNTAMHHFIAGLPVRQLGESPYVPAASDAITLPAAELGLAVAPGASVYLPPNIAGYIGADHVTMLLAAGILRRPGVVLALDIGTNTEITLAAGGRLVCCSCASGPAFEGAHIGDGMRAASGAIERVRLAGDEFRVHTIGDQPPVGICGSGILDAIASMLEAGVIDNSGNLKTTHPRVERRGGALAFILVPADKTGHGRDIVVTRDDVHEIQLAKGAIRASIDILLMEAGVRSDAIKTVVVAGAFGTYLDPASAVRVGMFPPLPVNRFDQLGNAAGMGAIQVLRSRRARKSAEALLEGIEYVELTIHPAFTDTYTDALFFGENHPASDE